MSDRDLPPRGDRIRYSELIEREARHWGAADQDPENPQLWDDPRLFELALAGPYRHLLSRAEACGSPVLELGCGDGDLALDLARRGLDVTGIDLSPERVARARNQARAAGLAERARFETGDLNVLPLPAESCACVVAHDALHHILRLEELLDRVHAALRPGGRLLVSDFTGAPAIEKLVSAAAVALLPTYQPYGRKWRLRGRLAALFASEESKREAVESGGAAALHDASPFEGISQESIADRVAARFEIVDRFTFCPFWYHAVPKIRMPRAVRYALLSAARRVDGPLNRRGWTRGSYCFIEARRR